MAATGAVDTAAVDMEAMEVADLHRHTVLPGLPAVMDLLNLATDHRNPRAATDPHHHQATDPHPKATDLLHPNLPAPTDLHPLSHRVPTAHLHPNPQALMEPQQDLQRQATEYQLDLLQHMALLNHPNPRAHMALPPAHTEHPHHRPARTVPRLLLQVHTVLPHLPPQAHTVLLLLLPAPTAHLLPPPLAHTVHHLHLPAPTVPQPLLLLVLMAPLRLLRPRLTVPQRLLHPHRTVLPRPLHPHLMVLPPPRPMVLQHLPRHLPTELPHLVVAAEASAVAVLAAVVLEAAVLEAAVSALVRPRQAMELHPVLTEHPRHLQAVMVLLAAVAAAAMAQAVATPLADPEDTPRAVPVVIRQEGLVSAVATLAAVLAAMVVVQEVTHPAEVVDTPLEEAVDTRQLVALEDTPQEVDIHLGAHLVLEAVTHQEVVECRLPSARATTPTVATCTRACRLLLS